jgi:hypothetical protein
LELGTAENAGLTFDRAKLLPAKVEEMVRASYGLSEAEGRALELDLDEALAFATSDYPDTDDGSTSEDEDDAVVLIDGPVERVRRLISYAFGCLVGRWDIRKALGLTSNPARAPDEPLNARPEGILDCAFDSAGAETDYPIEIWHDGIAVQDKGHPRDLETGIAHLLTVLGIDQATLEDQLPESKGHLGVEIQNRFFRWHLGIYSLGRRKAPIYWQLATPSASYSVWLYLHALTKDTIYKIQNDYVGPKLSHEERQLEALRNQFGQNPDATNRKIIAAQEKFVEEIRILLFDLKNVAPFWNPNLDDGVIINFAPLWRTVQNQKLWQKELRSAWEKLCNGDYDWAHLALHLWPERVVPKCASDRSLAIPHGLETAFWVRSISGPWRQRLGIADTVRYLEENLFSDRLRQTVEELVAFSKSYAAASGDAPDWWAALSTGFRDDTALALALWPERVIRKAVADPDRFAALGIKLPRARNGDELVAKLISTHRPRLVDQEVQTLAEFCDSPGSREYWSLRWEQFAVGIHDEYGIARAVHTPRVVAKSQADSDFAKFHDLFRWFWLLGDSGPRRLKEPADEIADALRIRSSLAVKAALKSLVEAPTATVSGVRGRGRQPTTAAPAGGTY